MDAQIILCYMQSGLWQVSHGCNKKAAPLSNMGLLPIAKQTKL